MLCSHNRSPYSNENKRITTTHNNIHDSHKHKVEYKKPDIKDFRASLVAQWLGVCLLMQGTRVRALVWEDPTCHGAAGPVSHNC